MNRSLMITMIAISLVLGSTASARAEGPALQPATASPATAAPPPTIDVEAQTALRRARVMKTAGGTSLGLGLALVGVSGISWMMRNTALRRADRRKFYVDEQRLIGRARRRHVASVVTLGMGASMTVIGTGLLIAGATWAGRARRRASLTPAIGPTFTGLQLRARF